MIRGEYPLQVIIQYLDFLGKKNSFLPQIITIKKKTQNKPHVAYGLENALSEYYLD